MPGILREAGQNQNDEIRVAPHAALRARLTPADRRSPASGVSQCILFCVLFPLDDSVAGVEYDGTPLSCFSTHRNCSMDQPIVTKSDIDQRDHRAARWSLIGCSALVFITSVCIMVLELTASRLIAKAVGSSLYTWTSVIGVILAGISIGNFLGGWLADRYDHRRSLAWLFFISSFCCITIYPLSQLMSTRGRPDWISWQLWVVVIVSALFLHPSIALGMISPITASMALTKARHTGSTVGNVYAWGAMGSIVGTFLAGFYLISMFGTQHIIWMTAATLALLGVIMAAGQRMFRGAMLFGWLQLVFWVGMLASVRQPEVSADDRVWFNDLLAQTHKLGLKLNLRSDEPDEYNAAPPRGHAPFVQQFQGFFQNPFFCFGHFLENIF